MMQENDQHQTVSFGQFPVNKLRTSTIKRRSIDFILEKFRFLENNLNWTERLKLKTSLNGRRNERWMGTAVFAFVNLPGENLPMAPECSAKGRYAPGYFKGFCNALSKSVHISSTIAAAGFIS